MANIRYILLHFKIKHNIFFEILNIYKTCNKMPYSLNNIQNTGLIAE